MKKKVLFLLPALLLVGCDKVSGVKCKTIKLSEGGSTFYRDSYSYSPVRIFRYVSEKGNRYIYTNAELTYPTFLPDGDTIYERSTLKIFEDRASDAFFTYYFDTSLGYVKYSHNIYLDVNSKKIDLIDEYEEMNDYEYNKSTEDKTKNKSAYDGVKSEFYSFSSSSSSEYVTIYKSEYKNATEKHTYINYGVSATVEYTLLD